MSASEQLYSAEKALRKLAALEEISSLKLKPKFVNLANYLEYFGYIAGRLEEGDFEEGGASYRLRQIFLEDYIRNAELVLTFSNRCENHPEMLTKHCCFVLFPGFLHRHWVAKQVDGLQGKFDFLKLMLDLYAWPLWSKLEEVVRDGGIPVQHKLQRVYVQDGRTASNLTLNNTLVDVYAAFGQRNIALGNVRRRCKGKG